MRLALVSLCVASTAWAQEPAPEVAAPAPLPQALRVKVSGYLQPQAVMKHRPDAVPRDRWEYGIAGSRAGIVAGGEPIDTFSWVLHVAVAARQLDVVTTVEPVDGDGDGQADALREESELTSTVEVEEATIQWRPLPAFALVAGRRRVPLTIEAQSANTELMFPQRAGPNEVFLTGTDLGVLAELTLATTTLSLGVWNGTGREAAPAGEDGRGLMVSGRADWSSSSDPWAEADFARGGPRFALGAGALFRQSVAFDDAGNDGAETRDLRLAGSARFAAGGFFLQAEVMRRQISDNLSSRLRAATGAYGQASFYVPTGAVALAPLVRIGWSREDEEIAARETLYLEAGLAFHPSSEHPEAVRIIVAYVGEQRKTEGEDAHAAVAQVQLRW